ncbi:cation transporter [Chroococcidiopsis sp. FACHB-1243]|uniref:cation diffusion facilitator family transporter n=1 Tax=Chroococcidiopsis sp. [FACHB-1243] TaxID=2692781 RepID=UPI001786B045|nr:cation diffusion facilitator family transporter [Chroococcidiopsis sp. [FACHB-1243]]MBD2305345.1 cation transporter [Chroococcidiopsis sp. [FACHB-1243]]
MLNSHSHNDRSHNGIHGCTCHTLSNYDRKIKLLWTALIAIASFAALEFGVGYWSHSLALQAESGHLLSDSFALALSLLAAWFVQRQAARGENFVHMRIEAIAAVLNGLGLVAIAVWIAIESVSRLQSPPTEILSFPMLVTAGVGLGVNGFNVFLLHDSSHHDLNVRGAFLHILADLISSIGVIVAAIAIWLMHWLWVDGAVGLFVSSLIFVSAIPLIIQSLNSIRNRVSLE